MKGSNVRFTAEQYKIVKEMQDEIAELKSANKSYADYISELHFVIHILMNIEIRVNGEYNLDYAEFVGNAYYQPFSFLSEEANKKRVVKEVETFSRWMRIQIGQKVKEGVDERIAEIEVLKEADRRYQQFQQEQPRKSF